MLSATGKVAGREKDQGQARCVHPLDVVFAGVDREGHSAFMSAL